jgi:hypothetical protein
VTHARDTLLAAGYAFLQERAALFVAEERLSRFLSDLPAHRELLAAWRARAGGAPRLRIVQAASNA